MIFGKYYELLFEANRERRIEHLVRKYKDDKRLDKCFEDSRRIHDMDS
jgi:hypothetical protein